MGRPEQQLEPGPLRPLAKWLRTQRDTAGLTYQQMAVTTRVPASTLSRAASGRVLPRLETVRAFAQVCGADPQRAQKLWEKASAEQRRHRASAPASPRDHRRGAYYPEYVNSPETLVKALLHLKMQQ